MKARAAQSLITSPYDPATGAPLNYQFHYQQQLHGWHHKEGGARIPSIVPRPALAIQGKNHLEGNPYYELFNQQNRNSQPVIHVHLAPPIWPSVPIRHVVESTQPHGIPPSGTLARGPFRDYGGQFHTPVIGQQDIESIHISSSNPFEARFMNNSLVPYVVPVRPAHTLALPTTTMSPSVRTSFVSPKVTQKSQSNGIFMSAQEGGSSSKGCSVDDYDWRDSPDCSMKAVVVESSGFATPGIIVTPPSAVPEVLTTVTSSGTMIQSPDVQEQRETGCGGVVPQFGSMPNHAHGHVFSGHISNNVFHFHVHDPSELKMFFKGKEGH